MASFVEALVLDLSLLRRGKISTVDARARAELARQALRGVSIMISASKFISGAAKLLESQVENPKQ
jgi:hypothetical protein